MSGLAGGEWWIGADPGVGNATPLSLAGGALTGTIPATRRRGTHGVSVRAVDVAGNWSDAGTAELTVTAVNENAVPTTPQDVPRRGHDLGIMLTGDDPDGDELTFAVVPSPQHGTLTGTAARHLHARADFHGSDSFTFTANDGVHSDPATVTITVTPVNDTPIATPASVSTSEDTAVAITLTGTDIDGDVLSFAIATLPPTWNPVGHQQPAGVASQRLVPAARQGSMP